MNASDPAVLGHFPYGLMRLSDMLNCYLSPLYKLTAQLAREMEQLSCIIPSRDIGRHPVSKTDKHRIESWLNVASDVANNFEWIAVHDRIELFSHKLGEIMLYQDLLAEIRVLHETIDCALRDQFVYRYPNDKSAVLDKWRTDWAACLSSFPSAEEDIVAGADCWALEHHTASVFHMMRVLEHGLRALANDLGKSFDVQNWQNVIDEIEVEIRNQGKTLPRGAPKNERLRFLSNAAKEFVYFKDGWRNYVSHSRAPYDEYQARSVMEHVREFMAVLSSQLHE